MPSILFVCTANMCRSPMATSILRKLIAAEPDAAEWRVESAGTWAMDGLPVAQKVFEVLDDTAALAEHASRGVTRELLRQFDLVLTMEQGHKEALRAEFPEVAPRVYLITEIVDLSHDIRDPIGGTRADFAETAQELRDYLQRGLPEIRRLAQERKR